MMIFRLCLCCFGFGRKAPNDSTHLLNKNSPTEPVKSTGEFYTVHKVSSFGRGVSHEDDGAHSDYEVTVSSDKNHAVLNKNNAAWCSRPVRIQLNAENDTASDLEESIARTPQGSPVVKKRGHWGKVLLKAKRDVPKNPTSFQSLASVSMMMLPTITVAGSSTSVAANLEEVATNNTSLTKKEREVKSLSSSPQASNGWLKSQSMLNVNCLSDNESDQSERSTDHVARKYGLDASLYDNMYLSKSMDAINRAWKSMEDFVNDNGFVDLPNGAVHFIASYNKISRKLLIRIEKIEGLAPKGVDRVKYDSIVKLTILPHEKHIKYSKVIPAHSTLDLDETFLFSVKEPKKKVLRISVYDVEFQGKYDAVGHALFYLEDALINEQKSSYVMKLYRQSLPDIQAGSLKIILNYNKHTEFLNIFIDEAYNLPSFSGKFKSYLKLTQHQCGRKIKEIYSPCVSAAQEVRYSFTVDLKIDPNTLPTNFVVISVKIKGFLKKDGLVGRIIMGPFLYAEYGKNFTPWGRALVNKETVSHVFRMYL